MLEFNEINIWAVLVVWFLYMAVGAVWYSPIGFAKKWKRHTGIDILTFPTNVANRILISVALSSLLQVLVLSIVLRSLNATTVVEGLIAGVVLWLGFTAATTVGVTLYSKRRWSFLWLNSAYFLVVMSIGSILLAVWR